MAPVTSENCGRPARNPRRAGASPTRRKPSSSGFTLIELLITIAIIGVLISLVLPMASRTVAAARGFKCQSALRTIADDFMVFADDNLHGYRGSAASRDRFRIDTFQDNQYGVNEFWCWEGEDRHDVPDSSGNDPMRCAQMRGPLVFRANAPCTGGGVGPAQNISFGFNVRLYIAERVGGRPPASWVELTSALLLEPNVPLVWDVDAPAAVARGTAPFFSGPSLDSPLVFAGDRFWFPGQRHLGDANFAFVDGHVAASRTPLQEQTWRWDFVPAH